MNLALNDLLALSFFVLVWFIYTQFARVRARSTYSLSYILRQLRIDWM